MSELLTSHEGNLSPERPFPWFCPRCRRKEVRRTTISYQCQRWYKGQPINIVVPQLALPCCGNCGERIFDYKAEEQINQAYQDQIKADEKTANV